MPYHLRDIFPEECTKTGCSKKAACTLYNGFNEPIAPYCARHGVEALALARDNEAATADALVLDKPLTRGGPYR